MTSPNLLSDFSGGATGPCIEGSPEGIRLCRPVRMWIFRCSGDRGQQIQKRDCSEMSFSIRATPAMTTGRNAIVELGMGDRVQRICRRNRASRNQVCCVVVSPSVLRWVCSRHLSDVIH